MPRGRNREQNLHTRIDDKSILVLTTGRDDESTGHHVVSTESWRILGNQRWCTTDQGRLMRFDLADGKRTLVKFHRAAMEAVVGPLSKDEQIDHISGDPADNRLCNLRIVSHKQNSMNVRAPNGGVCKMKSGRWQAQIRVDGRQVYLGTFASKKEARQAYRKACLKYRGEYARGATKVPQPRPIDLYEAREALARQHAAWRAQRAATRSGVRGVTWHQRDQVWRVRVTIAGKQRFVGNFRDLAEAVAAQASFDAAHAPSNVVSIKNPKQGRNQ